MRVPSAHYRQVRSLLEGALGDLLMCNVVARTRFICMAIILGAVSAPAAGQNGSEAELRQCLADLEASLHGRSILGPRGTAADFQSRGWLEGRLGITEYDVMVWRCQAEIYRRHVDQSQGRRVPTAKRRR